MERLKQTKDHDPRSAVDIHVRRLEELRRAGIMERIADGVWKVPQDLLQKAARPTWHNENRLTLVNQKTVRALMPQHLSKRR